MDMEVSMMIDANSINHKKKNHMKKYNENFTLLI